MPLTSLTAVSRSGAIDVGSRRVLSGVLFGSSSGSRPVRSTGVRRETDSVGVGTGTRGLEVANVFSAQLDSGAARIMNSSSAAFEIVCSILVEETHLTRPQARGSVRLALKAGGLRPTTATSGELIVVFERLMPTRLVAQGLDSSEAERLCTLVISRLETTDDLNAIAPGEMPNRLDKVRDD